MLFVVVDDMSDNTKFQKALSVLQQSVESGLKAECAIKGEFFAALEASQTHTQRLASVAAGLQSVIYRHVMCAAAVPAARTEVTHLSLRPSVVKTFNAVMQKVDLFSVQEAFRIRSWVLRCVSHNDLFSDDTYVFSRSMKAFTAAGLITASLLS